jgi:hypothetical protein
MAEFKLEEHLLTLTKSPVGQFDVQDFLRGVTSPIARFIPIYDAEAHPRIHHPVAELNDLFLEEARLLRDWLKTMLGYEIALGMMNSSLAQGGKCCANAPHLDISQLMSMLNDKHKIDFIKSKILLGEVESLLSGPVTTTELENGIVTGIFGTKAMIQLHCMSFATDLRIVKARLNSVHPDMIAGFEPRAAKNAAATAAADAVIAGAQRRISRSRSSQSSTASSASRSKK